jgi:hypothetical protein
MHAAATEHSDIRVADLAARQHGIVSRSQLAEMGLSSSAIRNRIALKRLHRVHHSVYAVGLPLRRWARYMAAVLACGDDAVLSYRAAAALLELRHPSSGRVEVTVPADGSRRRRGIRVHTTRHAIGTTVREGIPCTSPMRTLVDLATVLDHERQLKRVLERTLELDVFDRVGLEAELRNSGSRRGIAMLRRLLRDLPDQPPSTSSELERRLLELIKAAGLPYPVVNAHIGIYQVDFHWPAYKLVVETDGKATHGHAIAFHRDRDRDLHLNATGWRVLRLTWRQVGK